MEIVTILISDGTGYSFCGYAVQVKTLWDISFLKGQRGRWFDSLFFLSSHLSYKMVYDGWQGISISQLPNGLKDKSQYLSVLSALFWQLWILYWQQFRIIYLISVVMLQINLIRNVTII